MAEKFTYYAIIWPGDGSENPSGIARHVETDTGAHDEALGKDMTWHRTGLIVSWKRLESTEDLEEISEEQANALIDRFRERWANL